MFEDLIWSHGSTNVYQFDFDWKFGGNPHDRFHSPYLSESENAFAASISSEALRWRFVARRSMVRHLVSRYLSCEEVSVDFRTSESGKPYVAGYPIQFSTSSSGEYGLVGISIEAEIGVDIQKNEERLVDSKFEYFNDSEREAVSADMNPSEQFFRIWARKEACIKATGDGLKYDIRSLDVLSDFVEMPEPIQIWDLPVPEGYSAALAMVLT